MAGVGCNHNASEMLKMSFWDGDKCSLERIK
jgi:hypothetical protein